MARLKTRKGSALNHLYNLPEIPGGTHSLHFIVLERNLSTPDQSG